MVEPEANALQTLKAIRGALGDETPKCVFTAYDVAAVEKQGREAGAWGFLTKPIVIADFVQEMRKIL